MGALWTYNSEVDRWCSSPEAAPESAPPLHDIGPVATEQGLGLRFRFGSMHRNKVQAGPAHPVKLQSSAASRR